MIMPFSKLPHYCHIFMNFNLALHCFGSNLFWKTKKSFKCFGSPEQKHISGPNDVFYVFSYHKDASCRLP